MHVALPLTLLLAYGTQAACSSFGSVSFSTIEQCGSFHVNFTGGGGSTAFPLSLTILPFYANPISIPIPFATWDNSTAMGAAEVTFLPFYFGTQFIASLDDAHGHGTGRVSDVIKVQASRNSSCLPPRLKYSATDFYDIKGSLNQCSKFNVTFNSSLVKHAPKMRAFLPRSFSFPVNASGSPPLRGNQEYVLNVIHGNQALLLMDDGAGHQETTKLFTAGGDTSSPSSCLGFPPSSQSAVISTADPSKRPATMTQAAKIIVGAVCGGVVSILAVIVFIVARRKRIRTLSDLGSPSSSTKSFIFTEDVDMGSSFASRVRSRISQFLGSSVSVAGEKRSYRSYRDEEKSERPYAGEGSYGIPTSPQGSLVAPISRPASAARSMQVLSWVDVERALDDAYAREPARNKLMPVAEVSESDAERSPAVHQLALMPIPPLPSLMTARMRESYPDAPVPAVARSPSSQYGLGFRSIHSISGSWRRDSQEESGSSISDRNSQTLYPPAKSWLDISASSSAFSSADFIVPSPQSTAETAPRMLGERRGAGRITPFPTTSIASWRTSRTSQ